MLEEIIYRGNKGGATVACQFGNTDRQSTIKFAGIRSRGRSLVEMVHAQLLMDVFFFWCLNLIFSSYEQGNYVY